MAINKYDIGDDVRLSGAFTDANESAVDPTGVTIIVKKPDGTFVSYLSASGFSSQGNLDASTNDQSLANGTGTAGHYYTVTVAGTIDFGDGNITFAVGDYAYYNGKAWRRIPSPVTSPTLTNSPAGTFYVDQHVAQAGLWRWWSESVGERAGERKSFRVEALES